MAPSAVSVPAKSRRTSSAASASRSVPRFQTTRLPLRASTAVRTSENPARWVEAAESAALAALAARGEASTSDLAGDHPLLAQRLRLGVGTRWEAEVGTASRILLLLAV